MAAAVAIEAGPGMWSFTAGGPTVSMRPQSRSSQTRRRATTYSDPMASRTSRTRAAGGGDGGEEVPLVGADLDLGAGGRGGEVDEPVERDPADQVVPFGHLGLDLGQDVGHRAAAGGGRGLATGEEGEPAVGDEGQVEDGFGQGGGVAGQEAGQLAVLHPEVAVDAGGGDGQSATGAGGGGQRQDVGQGEGAQGADEDGLGFLARGRCLRLWTLPARTVPASEVRASLSTIDADSG